MTARELSPPAVLMRGTVLINWTTQNAEILATEVCVRVRLSGFEREYGSLSGRPDLVCVEFDGVRYVARCEDLVWPC